MDLRTVENTKELSTTSENTRHPQRNSDDLTEPLRYLDLQSVTQRT